MDQAREEFEADLHDNVDIEKIRKKHGRSLWFYRKGTLPVPRHNEFKKFDFLFKDVKMKIISESEIGFDMIRIPLFDRLDLLKVGDIMNDEYEIREITFHANRKATGLLHVCILQ
jgi:hypothetical protein